MKALPLFRQVGLRHKGCNLFMRRVFFLILLAALSAPAFAQTAGYKLPVGTKPFVLGVIDAIHSDILHERRVLNIYLPEGYATDDTARYPVVYLLDGSADEDFIHVAGLYQFNNFSWINRVPKSIVVGIANVDRKRDFTFQSSVAPERKQFPSSGHSGQFIDFIEKELQPFIDRKYRAAKGKTIIGQSLGGLLATEILFKRPGLFDQYIIISPSLWWSNGALLDSGLKTAMPSIRRPTGVYVGVGKEGLTPGHHPRVMEVDANLLAEKINGAGNSFIRVYLDYLPQENHATIAHQALFNALRLLHPPARIE
jgi:predicted alpha/beta superfamily hydrolase